MDTVLINGKEYDWNSISVNLLGRMVVGITAIDYEEKQEKQNNYGAGKFPVSRGYGNIVPSAKITLTAAEVEAIQTAAVTSGLERIQDIEPFDIAVSFVPGGTNKIVNHVLRNVEFTNNKRDVKQGDKENLVELELILSNIEWGI